MREDLPPPEYQDLHPIPGDGRVPYGWLRSIDRACTAWLLQRHEFGSAAQHRLDRSDDADGDDKEEAADRNDSVAVNPAAISKEVAP